MTLQDRLGLHYDQPNPLQRAVQSLASSRVGAWVFQRAAHHVDRPLFRLSNGRFTLGSLLGGVPVVLLTTTGHRSGLERTAPLLGIPVDGQVAVIGSNFGQAPTPAWVHNLEADPHACISLRGATVEVVARPATDAETERVFQRAAGLFPAFRNYRERAAHRTIRVFLLEPRD